MDSFEVIISPKALSQLNDYIDYPWLRTNGYRVVHFMRHRYLMLYRIEGTTAYVDAIYHQLQDYENTFADELNQ